MRRRWLLLAVLLALGTISACASSPEPSATATATTMRSADAGVAVEGYVVAGDDPPARRTVERWTHTQLAVVGIDGVTVTPAGDDLSPLPAATRGIVAAAHDRGAHAELLVSNFDGELGDFSPANGAALLRTPIHRAAVVQALADRVGKAGADGVQIDLESLEAADADGLTALATEVRAVLPAGATVSIALSAGEDVAAYRAAGYDLRALAEVVDRVVLMTYDQHGPTWSDPGPVGGIGWARRCVRALVAGGVPRRKVDLGIAQYGYSWPGDGSDGATLTVRTARSLAGSHARYDQHQQEWTATRTDGTVLWWSDQRSLRARLLLARSEHLHGAAIWQLGSAG